MTSSASPGTLLLVGAQEHLAAEILERLQHDGFDIAALPSGDAAALAQVLAPESGRAPQIDALVTITPTTRSGLAFDAIDDAAFEAALDAQVLSVLRTAQAVLPHMRSGGRIVHVGSRGYLGGWGGAHQMAASAALVALTRTMALELEPEGIYANVVASEFGHERMDTPRNRAAVAHAVSSLVAPASAGITAQCVLVDGLAGLRMSEARPARVPAKTS